MAKRGAQPGNRNGAHDKPWTNALQRALQQYSDEDCPRGSALQRIANGVVRDSLKGDPNARKEIFERLDGKPVQPVAATVDANITLEVIRFASGSDPK